MREGRERRLSRVGVVTPDLTPHRPPQASGPGVRERRHARVREATERAHRTGCRLSGNRRAPLSSITDVPAFARSLSGKNVWITTDAARRRGQVSSVSSTGLVLTEADGPVTIPFSQIVRVKKVTHRVRNGVLIGLASGAGVGILTLGTCDGPACTAAGLAFTPLFAGFGAGTGAGIGALLNVVKGGRDVLYDAGRHQPTIALAPILSRNHQGATLSVTWR